MFVHKQAGNNILIRSQRTWQRPETQVIQERSRDEWRAKAQVQSFFSRLSAISRKRGMTRAENVESSDEGDLLSVLLQEEIAFFIYERRDKKVKDIFNEMGANKSYHVLWQWYIRADQPRRTLKVQCENICEYFELSFKSKDTKAALMNKVTDMVKPSLGAPGI